MAGNEKARQKEERKTNKRRKYEKRNKHECLNSSLSFLEAVKRLHAYLPSNNYFSERHSVIIRIFTGGGLVRQFRMWKLSRA
jgi:hypothetical protein